MPARHPPPGYAASPAWSASVGSDLELHAELLVYGRARPGQELVLFGRRIAVEGDGSFRVRQPLSLAAVAPGALATPDDDTPGSG
jgi:hypothetical protein